MKSTSATLAPVAAIPLEVLEEAVSLLTAPKEALVSSDAAVVHVTEIESPNGVFRGSNPLGVSGVRVNQLELAPGRAGPEHDHAGNGQKRCTP
jgi:hypothetical protein